MTQLTDYLPQAATWFSKTLTYSGVGRIEFAYPSGWVEGEITCEVNHIGELEITLDIQRWENNDEPIDPSSIPSRDWLISGVQLNMVNDTLPFTSYSLPMPAENHIVSMSIQSSDGGRLTSDHIAYYSWNPIGRTIKLGVDKATYISANQVKPNATYWIVPCINLDLGHPFGTTRAYDYTNLRQHPLRIFPAPEKTTDFLASDASEEDKIWVHHNLTAMSYIVGFFYNNEPAFIERLPDYDRITQELRDGIARLGVTSVMIGACTSEADEMRPVDLLPVLGLATGRPVGASWIEFRDQNANLVYRIHAHFGRYSYGRGRTTIMARGGVQDGLGKLLTEAALSPILSDSLVRGALRNCAMAISGEDGTAIFY